MQESELDREVNTGAGEFSFAYFLLFALNFLISMSKEHTVAYYIFILAYSKLWVRC